MTYSEDAQFHSLQFADNGIGIEQQFHDKVFELFTRLHNRSIYQGSGLGLAICKNIVHRMDGSIALESQLGEGTVFTVRLPKTVSSVEGEAIE